MATPFVAWFESISGFVPHAWQRGLGEAPSCVDRLLRIPTGFGKTAGVVLPWLYHRVVRGDTAWPRRLVYCLPMRVLVEQTERTMRAWLGRGLDPAERPAVHVLMGGVEAEPWAIDPDRSAILLGTQDMLLSRALNRGYGAARGRWPMEMGLLHSDVLWVLDEVQLMDVGLATSAQLAAFRRDDAQTFGHLRPACTWWMSATLQPAWLRTVDWRDEVDALAEATVRIPADARTDGLFEVTKRLGQEPEVAKPKAAAQLVVDRHRPGELTLVIVNTVERALEVFDALVDAYSEGKGKKRALRDDAPELRLVHSRFRGHERARWSDPREPTGGFLRRDADPGERGRIIVSTQVIEAGVDISARLLVTDLAPWPSLVQRFGRAARYADQAADIVVIGSVPKKDADALPYTRDELAAAIEALDRLDGAASPRALEAFEDSLAEEDLDLLERLYPYEPEHVLRRRDIDQLFDTSADLSGADLDVGRFIRSGEERDARVFWRADLPEVQRRTDEIDREHVPSPRREELCPVPVGRLREWLEADRKKRPAFVLDYNDGTWRRREPRLVHTGHTVLLPADAGGYADDRGWSPKATGPVEPVAQASAAPEADALTLTSEAEEDDTLSVAEWKTVAVHGHEAASRVRAIAERLGLEPALAHVLDLAARWHDAGKVHAVFQAAVRDEHRERAREATGGLATGRDLAKAPAGAWRRPPYPERPGFRHELASTLALFELLRRVAPDHDALTGPHAAMLEACGEPPVTFAAAERVEADHPLAAEIASLSAADFDLVAWLVCTHHGKVRCAWASTPHDQQNPDRETGRVGIHGVREGDPLEVFELADADGVPRPVPALELSLDAARMGLGPRYGPSWTERAAALLARRGPFALAFLEAVLRAADVRASRDGAEGSTR